MKKFEEDRSKYKEYSIVIMDALGYSDDEIKKHIEDFDLENAKKDEIISELINPYSLSLHKCEFPTKIYEKKLEEGQIIFVEAGASKWINIYDSECISYMSFDVLDSNCLQNVCEHLDNLIKRIKI